MGFKPWPAKPSLLEFEWCLYRPSHHDWIPNAIFESILYQSCLIFYMVCLYLRLSKIFFWGVGWGKLYPVILIFAIENFRSEIKIFIPLNLKAALLILYTVSNIGKYLKWQSLLGKCLCLAINMMVFYTERHVMNTIGW